MLRMHGVVDTPLCVTELQPLSVAARWPARPLACAVHRAGAMHLYLTARHFELTEAIREHVQQHIVRAVEEHADPHDLNRVEVQLSVGQRDARYRCHVLVQLPKHRDLNVSEEGKDLYAAIDLAQKRLVRALVENRQRDKTTQRHPKKFSWDRIARILRSAR